MTLDPGDVHAPESPDLGEHRVEVLAGPTHRLIEWNRSFTRRSIEVNGEELVVREGTFQCPTVPDANNPVGRRWLKQALESREVRNRILLEPDGAGRAIQRDDDERVLAPAPIARHQEQGSNARVEAHGREGRREVQTRPHSAVHEQPRMADVLPQVAGEPRLAPEVDPLPRKPLVQAHHHRPIVTRRGFGGGATVLVPAHVAQSHGRDVARELPQRALEHGVAGIAWRAGHRLPWFPVPRLVPCGIHNGGHGYRSAARASAGCV